MLRFKENSYIVRVGFVKIIKVIAAIRNTCECRFQSARKNFKAMSRMRVNYSRPACVYVDNFPAAENRAYL